MLNGGVCVYLQALSYPYRVASMANMYATREDYSPKPHANLPKSMRVCLHEFFKARFRAVGLQRVPLLESRSWDQRPVQTRQINLHHSQQIVKGGFVAVLHLRRPEQDNPKP